MCGRAAEGASNLGIALLGFHSWVSLQFSDSLAYGIAPMPWGI